MEHFGMEGLRFMPINTVIKSTKGPSLRDWNQTTYAGIGHASTQTT